MANTVIYRNSVSSGATKITFSAWVKVSAVGGQLFSCYTSNDRRAKVYFASNQLRIWLKDSSGNEGYVYTARVFTDPNAFYHIVVAQDNTLSTDTDRIKIYINGVRETATWSGSKPTQNSTTWILGHGKVMHGTGYYNSSFENQYFDGLMSHIHVCYGTALAPTVFGSVDSTTGEWKINTAPSFTPGTNGFTILKDGNTITDESANSNNFSLGGGTITVTKDCPDNVFATLNPLMPLGSNIAYSNGNLTITPGTSDYKTTASTIAVGSGKFYTEFKAVSGHNGSTDVSIGIVGADTFLASTTSKAMSAYTNAFSYGSGGLVKQYNGATIRTDATFTNGNIIGIAVDMDNLKLYWSKNGTYNNSGDPTSGSTGTGAIAITAGQPYYICAATISSGGVKVFSANFGSPPYANSSSAADGNGFGDFEYAPPSGYFSLNTKNLAEYG